MPCPLWPMVRNMSRPLYSLPVYIAVVSIGTGLYVGTAAYAGRQAEQDNVTYTIKRIYTVGDNDSYRIHVRIDALGAGPTVHLIDSMFMKEMPQEATKMGASRTAFAFDHATITLNDMEKDVTAQLPRIVVARDKSGKSELTMEGGNKEFITEMDDQLRHFVTAATVFLPAKPVKVGETWSVPATGFVLPNSKARGKVTLISVETVKDLKIGTIKSVIDTADKNKNKMHTETTLLIDLATGKALSILSNAVGGGGDNKMQAEMTIDRLGPEDRGDNGGRKP